MRTRDPTLVPQPGCSSWPDISDDSKLMPPPPPPTRDTPPPPPHASSPLLQPPQPSVFHDELSWSLTPNEALITVFKHLGDRDRCSAALVCKKWLQVSRAACLWRRRHFDFSGADAVERLQRYKVFITFLGQHVQHAVLDFGRPNMNTANAIAKAFEGFVSKVHTKTRMRLHSITARNLDFQTAWRFFSHHRGKVVRSLCTLFRRQTSLRMVNLAFSQLNKDEGLRVLDSLALAGTVHRQHKQLLANVDLQDFFSPRTRVHSSSKFADAMGNFVALTSLCMDKRYLNEEVLERLTSRTKGAPLRNLQLITDSLDPVLDHPISHAAWCAAIQRVPCLTVGVLFLGLASFEKYGSVLVWGMPLARLRLSWLGVVGPVLPAMLTDVEKMLRHVAFTFNNTITRIQVCLWPEAVVTVDEALVTLVSRCHMLRELCVTCKVSPETLDKLEAVLASRQDSEMETMEVRLLGLTKEMTTADYIQRRWPRIRCIKILPS